MPPGGQWLSRHCALPANPAPSTSPSNSNLMFPSVFPHCGPLIAWRALTEKMYWYQDFFSLFPFWTILKSVWRCDWDFSASLGFLRRIKIYSYFFWFGIGRKISVDASPLIHSIDKRVQQVSPSTKDSRVLLICRKPWIEGREGDRQASPEYFRHLQAGRKKRRGGRPCPRSLLRNSFC